jgi:succinate-semialdehyde dehydrogenase/glutarate-semialdehyde dehydrogenase
MIITAKREQDLIASIPTELFIDGSWCAADGGERFAVEDPATGRQIAAISDATPADALHALDAAHHAQTRWARTSTRERSEILYRAFDLIHQRADDFALLLTLEMGKPLHEARSEVIYGAEFFRWFAEEAPRIHGRYGTAPQGASRILVTKKAVGPCLLITPWNFPLAMATRKIAPALAAGCTAVVKPANLTPLTTNLLASVLVEAGLPPGVVNVIPTTRAADVVETLMRDGRLRKISFTGSTAVGRQLMRQAADTVMRSSMELGGNAPFVVCADAHISTAVDGAVTAKLRNMGEACTAANRFLVHESVADEFGSRLATRVKELAVGRGTDQTTQIGPLIESKARTKVSTLVDDAVRSGARVLTGGHAIDGPGYFYTPTVLTEVAPDTPLFREEIFGPVAPITTFANDDEAISLANASEYGLAAYLFTQSIDRGLRLAEEIEAGMLGLNTGLISDAAAPFGGIKQSGQGREGGFEGIDEYLETRYIGTPITPAL